MFWPHPSGDRLKVSKPVHTWVKNGVKSLPCQGNVAIAWCPEGWAVFYFGCVIGHRGRSCHRNLVSKNLKRGCCKNTFFQINGEAIGGQSCEKSLQMAEVCLPVRRTDTWVIHICTHTFQTIHGAIHHSLKCLCGVGQSKRGEQIFEQTKWRNNCRFWDVLGRDTDLVITLDKINFWKNCATV